LAVADFVMINDVEPPALKRLGQAQPVMQLGNRFSWIKSLCSIYI